MYLKIQLFYGYNDNDMDTVTLHYVQSNYDVIHGKFNLEEDDIYKLASLQLMINHGNIDHQNAYKYLEHSPECYIPWRKYKTHQPEEWVEKIMAVYSTMKFTSKIDAKLTYLETLKPNSLWESHQLYIKYSKSFNTDNHENFPDEEMILGIKPTGLTIQTMERIEFLFIPYQEILSWGVNDTLFVLIMQKKKKK